MRVAIIAVGCLLTACGGQVAESDPVASDAGADMPGDASLASTADVAAAYSCVPAGECAGSVAFHAYTCTGNATPGPNCGKPLIAICVAGAETDYPTALYCCKTGAGPTEPPSSQCDAGARMP